MIGGQRKIKEMKRYIKWILVGSRVETGETNEDRKMGRGWKTCTRTNIEGLNHGQTDKKGQPDTDGTIQTNRDE